MPLKSRYTKKSQEQCTPESTWLSKFCRAIDIPEEVMDVQAQYQINSKSFFAAMTEQDFAHMGFVVGQKIQLRRVLSRLWQDDEDPPASEAVSSEEACPSPRIRLPSGAF